MYVEPADGLRFRLRNKERDTYYMVEDASNHLVIAEDRYAEGGTFTLEKADASSYYIKRQVEGMSIRQVLVRKPTRPLLPPR